MNPVWNQKFYTLINHIGDLLTIEVVDDDIGKNDSIGTAEVSDIYKFIVQREFILQTHI